MALSPQPIVVLAVVSVTKAHQNPNLNPNMKLNSSHTRSRTLSLTDTLTHSFTDTLTHSLTHSPHLPPPDFGNEVEGGRHHFLEPSSARDEALDPYANHPRRR